MSPDSTLFDSTVAGADYSALLRIALLRSFALTRERDLARLRELLVKDVIELTGCSAARFHDLSPGGSFENTHRGDGVALPPLACEMEAELLARALARGQSLISSHPGLDHDLRPLAHRCEMARITTHILLLRAADETYGAVAAHWLGKERPVDYHRRSVFYAYWDNAEIVVAAASERIGVESERAELRRTAFFDRLTDLPNDAALQKQLDAHAETYPFAVLMIDFDGLRAANAAYGYVEGGNALIQTVAGGLAGLTSDGEFLARMNTAGDEFVLLLPGQANEAAERRRRTVEHDLERLPVPAKFDQIYRGASVGAATRQPKETPGQTLGRAVAAMRARKLERQNA